jgi:DNA-binding XRE family transcriptional regulator
VAKTSLARSALQLVAYWQDDRSKRKVPFRFPDVPGCHGTAIREDLYETAFATVEEALKEELAANKLPSWSRMHEPPKPNEKRLIVVVSPSLTLAVQVRRMRLMKGWTQAELAVKLGVRQQQVAKLESADGNPTFESVAKIAKVFDHPVAVVFH